jgi:hypothetical protein
MTSDDRGGVERKREREGEIRYSVGWEESGSRGKKAREQRRATKGLAI